MKRYGYPEWSIFTIFKPVVFFGLYHIGDWLRFIFHRGERYVFWCGSDILTSRNVLYFLSQFTAKHYCENEVEQVFLMEHAIYAEIRPQFFGEIEKYTVCFKPSKRLHVYLCAREGREKEYGVPLVEEIARYMHGVLFHIYGIRGKNESNILYHGHVPTEQFDQEIRNYHVSLRLNVFDGFGDSVAKSVLMGQYPLTMITYPHIQQVNERTLLPHLILLSQKKKPNYEARDYWYHELSRTLP